MPHQVTYYHEIYKSDVSQCSLVSTQQKSYKNPDIISEDTQHDRLTTVCCPSNKKGKISEKEKGKSTINPTQRQRDAPISQKK